MFRLARGPWVSPRVLAPSRAVPTLIVATALSHVAHAQSTDAAVAVDVGDATRIEVTGRHYDNAVGSSDAASQGTIRAELLKSRPALRPGEVLEFVPGVIVTQHSGDGKANQYFLRGFNLDHGTDFATTVNGLPVNMPSHGHGQGYADLNFLIPELVDHIDYRKGPYFASHGDFAAAGSADISYRTALDAPLLALTLGEHGFRRAVGGGSVAFDDGLTVLGMLDLQRNDGPWAVPERLRKTNGVVTVSGGAAGQGWSASVMGYEAEWTATNQIPQRLIDAGSYQGRPFGRFDSLDPSDGGQTHRHSVSGEWHRRGDSGLTRLSAFAMDYQLALYSNATYAMDRPDDGDQVGQKDERRTYGLATSHAFDHALGTWQARSELGLQLRHDQASVGLFTTVEREATGTLRDDRVRETLVGVYGQTQVEVTPWMRAVAGLRADRVRFKTRGLSDTGNSGSASDQLLSPKLSLVFGPWAKTELFVNAGRGFHSNDARGATDPVAPVPGLVPARGWELGGRTEWVPGLQSSLALWKLDFDSELVYVGDAGTNEAQQPSKRHGVEWNNRYAPLRWLLLDADLAWTHARFKNGDRIPNAVDQVASVAVTARDLEGWSASLQWRYLGSSALIEDNSVRSHPSLTANARVSKAWGRGNELTLDVFNLFNRRVNDIEYFYESQLPGEAAPAADRHLHPAEPRTWRLSLNLAF